MSLDVNLMSTCSTMRETPSAPAWVGATGRYCQLQVPAMGLVAVSSVYGRPSQGFMQYFLGLVVRQHNQILCTLASWPSCRVPVIITTRITRLLFSGDGQTQAWLMALISRLPSRTNQAAKVLKWTTQVMLVPPTAFVGMLHHIGVTTVTARVIPTRTAILTFWKAAPKVLPPYFSLQNKHI